MFRNVSVHNESALRVVGFGGHRLAFAFWKEAPRDNLQCTKSLSKTFGASFQKANASHERRRNGDASAQNERVSRRTSRRSAFHLVANRSVRQQVQSCASLAEWCGLAGSSFLILHSAFAIRNSVAHQQRELRMASCYAQPSQPSNAHSKLQSRPACLPHRGTVAAATDARLGGSEMQPP